MPEDDKPATGHLAGLLRAQFGFAEVLAAAILVGFSINVLASLILERLPDLTALVIGTLTMAAGLALLASRIFVSARSRSRRISGFFIYDPEESQAISPGRDYPFADWFALYIRAASREDPAIREAWGPAGEGNLTGLPRMALAQALAEYVVLNELAVHLTDYFGGRPAARDLRHITARDLPDALVQNPFVEFFSRPIEDRPNFSGGTAARLKPSETVVMTIVIGGGIYERFDLVLPAGSELARTDQGALRVSTRRFTLTLRLWCPGTTRSLPPGYLTHYLGLDAAQASRIRSVECWLTVDVRFRAWALASPYGWSYYRWLDSWLANAEEKVSATAYFDRIGWQQAATFLRVLHRTERRERPPTTTE
ncbi:hypothetical protein VSS74_01360 [Conexibacter stalactiti]|uniref:Uncharacterized protein n=1 Tax=Conexibacter stalactiti TaxID=1940611 RepID=A0ABU4HI85_9ACTN|nr:hypothetical protein [Conexibacter stalactiti]MDW5592965.1 hypothetical protein [Conexibacter stalactiti]MEC5033606.1 hypothetical protein [Conexibacter stalactiti]